MDYQPPTTPVAIIMGNERHGLDAAIINEIDQVLSIPMQGNKNSLNVAVTTGIVAHWIVGKFS